MMLRLLSELSFSPIEFQNIVFELLSTFFQLFLFLCMIFFQFIEFVMKLGNTYKNEIIIWIFYRNIKNYKYYYLFLCLL